MENKNAKQKILVAYPQHPQSQPEPSSQPLPSRPNNVFYFHLLNFMIELKQTRNQIEFKWKMYYCLTENANKMQSTLKIELNNFDFNYVLLGNRRSSELLRRGCNRGLRNSRNLYLTKHLN